MSVFTRNIAYPVANHRIEKQLCKINKVSKRHCSLIQVTQKIPRGNVVRNTAKRFGGQDPRLFGVSGLQISLRQGNEEFLVLWFE